MLVNDLQLVCAALTRLREMYPRELYDDEEAALERVARFAYGAVPQARVALVAGPVERPTWTVEDEDANDD